MEASGIEPIKLMCEVISEHTPESIWKGSVLGAYRHVGMTNRGAIGEEFVRRYVQANGIHVEKSEHRTDPTDMDILGVPFEVKTASLGANGTFQFNHIRLDKGYKYLLCLGVCPDAIVFNAWRKGDLAEGNAGRLVRMAEGQSITFKLTKRLSEMNPVEDLPTWVKSSLGTYTQTQHIQSII